MADTTSSSVTSSPATPPFGARSLDEARALARERFKTRLLAGEKIGDCDCHSETDPMGAPGNGATAPVHLAAGVRFRDSGRTYYFRPSDADLVVGDWVVVETSRGQEAGRVVIAPHQVGLNRLEGELKPILRRLDYDAVLRMERLKRDAAGAVRTFGTRLRARGLPLKPISAEYNFDGSSLVLHYSLHDRERHPDGSVLRDLSRELAGLFGCRVDLRQVGPRDEARLLGGLGRCGRTLCCSSWLPVYPEISMNMAKTQDLPLNPSKVSGVCGRLLCCLSYENEQYKQMKAVMPRLGQSIETPAGPGTVVSLQILRELVTVRLTADGTDLQFTSADLGMASRAAESVVARGVPASDDAFDTGESDAATPGQGESRDSGGPALGPRRRRRRRGQRPEASSGSSRT